MIQDSSGTGDRSGWVFVLDAISGPTADVDREKAAMLLRHYGYTVQQQIPGAWPLDMVLEVSETIGLAALAVPDERHIPLCLDELGMYVDVLLTSPPVEGLCPRYLRYPAGINRVVNGHPSVRKWCEVYRELGIPADTEGLMVHLYTSSELGLLSVPAGLARVVSQRCGVPTMASYRPRWLFPVRPDSAGVPDELGQAGVRLSSTNRGLYYLPTIHSRRVLEAVWWEQSWPSAETIPLLSSLVDAIAGVLSQSGTGGCTEAHGSGV